MSADVFAQLQLAIERLHGVKAELDVRAYLVSHSVFVDIPGARVGLPEQLFVREQGDEMELALYIAPEVVRGLALDDPYLRLHPGNLEWFCIALEGVSHFVFVAWRARVGWPVSPLELEIQAEVDKFVAAWLLLAEQGRPLLPTAQALKRQLFEGYALREELAGEEVDRYQVATRVARQFCERLASRFGRDHDAGRIERAVHRFVRQELGEKLRRAA